MGVLLTWACWFIGILALGAAALQFIKTGMETREWLGSFLCVFALGVVGYMSFVGMEHHTRIMLMMP